MFALNVCKYKILQEMNKNKGKKKKNLYTVVKAS